MRTRRSAWSALAAAVAVAIVCWANAGSALAARSADSGPTLLAPAPDLVAPATAESHADGPPLSVAPAPQWPAPRIRAVDQADAWLRIAAAERLLAVAPKTSPPLR